jgi:thioredoxin 1
VQELTDETFEREVLGSGTPVVVDFWAPWCGPCHAITPILEALEAEYTGQIDFAKLNIDENPETASRFDVFSIPTVILFDAGQPRQVVVGARPRTHFEQAFAPWLSTADV